MSYDHPLASVPLAAPSTSTHSPSGGGLPFKRSSSSVSLDSSASRSRPTTPTATTSRRGSSSTSLLTKDELDQQASQIILGALDRTSSRQPKNSSTTGSFSKMSLSSMMGGLSALSLSRNERGRSATKDKGKEKARARSSSYAGRQDDESDGASQRARSQSPFHLRRTRTRDSSPTVEALTQSDVESDVEVNRIRPRNNAFSVAQSDDESPESSDEDAEDSDDDGSWSEGDQFDTVTEKNTERNALVPADRAGDDAVDFPDPLGEGVNVVIPPEPYFPSTLNTGARNPRRRKSTRPHDTLPLDTSRPIFQRDRCTINLTHGSPERALEESGRRPKRYVLASDLSDESRYALEWGIGTVLRDGDEMYVLRLYSTSHRRTDTEPKADCHHHRERGQGRSPHPEPERPHDQAALSARGELSSQIHERCTADDASQRQGMAYILVRQTTSLLQRTHLHVTVSCQAWHAKNARHMLLGEWKCWVIQDALVNHTSRRHR